MCRLLNLQKWHKLEAEGGFCWNCETTTYIKVTAGNDCTKLRVRNLKWKKKCYVKNNFVWKKVDILSKFSAISDRGDKFCGFLFVFKHTKALLKRGLLL